jgi:CBS domain-containing protein
MIAEVKSLSALTASDLMSREVTTIPQEMSLEAAAHILWQAQVSGAPVVDGAGQVVGVLSATDFVHWTEDEAHNPTRDRPASPCFNEWPVEGPRTDLTGRVRDYMTHDPVMVPLTTPLQKLARMMLDAHIHRVVVVDPSQRPVGVVSSTDVLAAVAYQGRAEEPGELVPAKG